MDQAIESFDRFDGAVESACSDETFCMLQIEIEEKFSVVHSCGVCHCVDNFLNFSFEGNITALNSLINSQLEKLLNDSPMMNCEEFENQLRLFSAIMYFKWEIYRKLSELPATQA